MSVLRTAYSLGYEISPIVLTGGVASLTLGAMPIAALLQAGGAVESLLNGSLDGILDLDDYFAKFKPMPGSTLQNNQIGLYPFANQSVAANAVITHPNAISMIMFCPASGDGGFFLKTATMTLLKATLDKHRDLGGTYTVMTPACIYDNCILTSIRDVTVPDDLQVQTAYQFDFLRPLLTLEDAQQAQDNLMSKISAGGQFLTQPTWSGIGASISNFASGAIQDISGLF